ncbi:MAG: ABC transporter permease [Paracoccaceae bacterium]|nr:ABC transporter permease [Paracoccaceae bacterium]MDG2259852.1 ABC transporter permease [Paracoccaceae bacterium]
MLREVESGGTFASNTVVWAVVEPIFGIALLSIVFAIALPAPPLGDSFAFFYASGLLPLMLFQDVTQKMIVAVRYSRPLLGFAIIGPVEMVFSRAAVAILVQLTVMTAILGGLAAISSQSIQFEISLIILGLFAVIALALGLGLLGSLLSLDIPSWPKIWAIVLRPLVFISGVFFLTDEIPDPFRDWAMWNPLAQVIVIFRQGLYYHYDSAAASFGYVASIGLVCAGIGLLGLRARASRLINGVI